MERPLHVHSFCVVPERTSGPKLAHAIWPEAARWQPALLIGSRWLSVEAREKLHYYGVCLQPRWVRILLAPSWLAKAKK